ncbi:MAG: hypothetical protein RR444_09760 [Oscillospiraceae bacterium]
MFKNKNTEELEEKIEVSEAVDTSIEVYQLEKPIKINGEVRTELKYDFNAITAKDIMQVSRDLKSKGVVVMMAQFDDENLINLFAKAVGKADSSVTLNDLMRLGAKDTFKITAITRSFFYREDSADTQEN